MIDMKLTAEEAKKPGGSCATMMGGEPNDGPKYPDGLEIRLNAIALSKLAIGPGNLPQVGTRITITAQCEVCCVEKEDNQISNDLCVELQIQQMEIAPAEAMGDAQRIDNLFAAPASHG